MHYFQNTQKEIFFFFIRDKLLMSALAIKERCVSERESFH